ncbi:MAG TPA: hypothetical protein PLH43_05420 [Acetivibrio sp.]|uniref:hypothetical protein n=1 Tax=Acetivibrio sp. TaxID=1872092 RepID=UPI002B70A916|nr:hypothetical protein [Acetivibrio sp.]HOM02252.1 hypothetical protein [Acetivibrio sp.]
MFRRLFISLLILSTLTSDGTVNIAGYLIDLYRYDGIDLDLIILDDSMPEKADLDSIEDTSPDSLGSSCIICADSSENDGKKSYSFAFLNREYDYTAFLYIPSVQWIGVNTSCSWDGNDISLYMSDLSPPCI